jgi:Chitin synthase export chaperone
MAFGEFDWICTQASIPLCSVVGAIRTIEFGVGIEADCYARNIELANTIIFQGAASFMHIVALLMTVIMILHVRSKFTAVGMFIPLDCMESPLWLTDNSKNRSQGNHNFLLPLYALDFLLALSRFRCYPSWLLAVSLLHGRASRACIRSLRLSTGEWVRRIPTV